MTMDRIRQGDPEALRALLEEAWAPLVRYLERRVESGDEAEDVAQEAFVRIWERRERWTGGSARAVLFRIGRNLALDRGRRRAVRRRWAEEARQDPAPSPPTPADELAATELRGRVAGAVEALPERRREVFRLVRLQGLTYAEVAEILGVSAQTVANQMSMALRDLRAAVAGQASEDVANGADAPTRSDHG